MTHQNKGGGSYRLKTIVFDSWKHCLTLSCLNQIIMCFVLSYVHGTRHLRHNFCHSLLLKRRPLALATMCGTLCLVKIDFACVMKQLDDELAKRAILGKFVHPHDWHHVLFAFNNETKLEVSRSFNHSLGTKHTVP